MARANTRRISCSALARIVDPVTGTYALLHSRKRSSATETMYSPIGGALRREKGGKRFLRTSFDASTFENDDLRFRIPPEHCDAFANWFEISDKSGLREECLEGIKRELHEELVDEEGLLAPGDLEGTFCTSLGYRRRDDRSTLRLSHLYEVTLPAGALNKLLAVSRRPFGDNPPVIFATEAEIKQGGITDAPSRRIAAISMTLLDKEIREPLANSGKV